MHESGHDPEVLKELRSAPDLAPRLTKVMARSLGCAMSTLVVQEHHLWLCLVDIGMPKMFGSSRARCPRLASSVTQSGSWPSSSQLHRSRLRRSNISCLSGQLLHCIRSSLQMWCRGAGRRQVTPPVLAPIYRQ